MNQWIIQDNSLDSDFKHLHDPDLINRLKILSDYDKGEFNIPQKHTEVLRHDHAEISYIFINALKQTLQQAGESVDLFGVEQSQGKLGGIITSLYQTISNQELYPYFEDKAAHLLYFIIKNHPFIDGNKRIALFLFGKYFSSNVLKTLFPQGFTQQTYTFTTSNISKTLQDFVNLTLVIAESKPEQKDTIINLTSYTIYLGFEKMLSLNIS